MKTYNSDDNNLVRVSDIKTLEERIVDFLKQHYPEDTIKKLEDDIHNLQMSQQGIVNELGLLMNRVKKHIGVTEYHKSSNEPDRNSHEPV
jgi:hypothetical protein